jgi:large repetitive protein
VTNSFLVTVREVNVAPGFVGLSDGTVDELATYQQVLTVSDSDVPAQNLTLTLLSGPSGSSINNGVFSWVPNEAQGPSTSEVVVAVSDGQISTTNRFSVVVREVNVAPGFVGLSDGSVDELATYQQVLTVSDSDVPAQNLTLTLLSGPSGSSINNGVFSWVPNEAQGPSTSEVVVAVSDGQVSTTNRFSVVVREVNSLPSLAGATNTTIDELVGYTQSLVPSDSDVPVQALGVTLLSGPTGLVVTNGVLAWTPSEAEGPSINEVVVAISDGVGAVTNSFLVTVREVNVAPGFVGLSDGTVDELATYQQVLTVSDSDVPAQNLTLTLLSGPSGSSINNGVFSWVPNEAQGPSTSEVVVAVSDGQISTTNRFSVVVREVNVAPGFVGLSDGSVDELATYQQVLTVVDSDVPAQNLTLTLLSGPSGSSINNGVFNWVPNEAQGPSTSEVVVAVSDGQVSTTNRFSVVAREVNTPPTMAGATDAILLELVGFIQDLMPRDTDVPAQTLTVNLISGPQGLTVINGIVSWTPTAAQGPSTNTVVVAISDGVNAVTNRFELKVIDVNTLPTLVGATSATISEMVGYTQNLAPTDSDIPAQSLTVTLLSGPIGMVVTNGVLAWTPSEAQGPSTNTVTVAVTDGVGSVTNSFVLTVREVNVLPTLPGATNAAISELVGYTQNLAPTDGDIPVQSLTVTLLGGPTGIVVTNGVLAWTPSAAQGPSTNIVTVAVTDGVGSVTNSFVLTVRDGNVLPTLVGATNATIFEMVGYTQNLAPVDSDIPAQSLTVTLLGGPTGIVVTNGVLAWTPSEAQGPSTNTVTVAVTDGVGSVTNSFVLTVREVNVLPTLVEATNATISELVGYTQNLAPTDSDIPAQSLTVTLLSGPIGMVVTNGVLAWTPSEAQGPSTNTVTVAVTDGVGTVTNSFVLTAREVNGAPRWGTIQDGVVMVGSEYLQRLEALDDDLPAQVLAFRLLDAPAGASLDSGLFRWTPVSSQGESTHRIVVSVSDGLVAVTKEFLIRVTAASTPPAFVGIPELSGDRLRLRFRIQASTRLEVSEDMLSWRSYSTPGGTEGSVVVEEIPVELGYKFFRLVRTP